MTEGNDIGFDAWRGKIVGVRDSNPFHTKEPAPETPKEEKIEEPAEGVKSDQEESARTIVTDGVLPGAIFDAQSMNEAIEKEYKIFHLNSGDKDHFGNPILEIVVSDGHTEKAVGYTVTKNQDGYAHFRKAELK